MGRRRQSSRDARSPGRRVVWSAVAIAVVVLAAYVGLPQIAGLDETRGRLSEGDPWWLAVAVVLEAGSYGGYVRLFRGVLVHPGPRIGWRQSYEITMSGVAATRLLATGGVGGVALTGWALGARRGDRSCRRSPGHGQHPVRARPAPGLLRRPRVASAVGRNSEAAAAHERAAATAPTDAERDFLRRFLAKTPLTQVRTTSGTRMTSSAARCWLFDESQHSVALNRGPVSAARAWTAMHRRLSGCLAAALRVGCTYWVSGRCGFVVVDEAAEQVMSADRAG
jgi:hypothetical protein